MTPKQEEILRLICKGNPDGSFLDLDQLREGLSYGPTKDALAFSVRFLCKSGLLEKKPLEKRRGQSRRVLAPTMQGFIENKYNQ